MGNVLGHASTVDSGERESESEGGEEGTEDPSRWSVFREEGRGCRPQKVTEVDECRKEGKLRVSVPRRSVCLKSECWAE